MVENVPRPEYPRPQLFRRDWLNLNGEWEFEEDPGKSGEARGLTGGQALSGRIIVPFAPESKLSGIGKRDFMECVWYRRHFRVPGEWAGRRIFLHFGAVDYEADVWVNGRRVGGHRGGYTPFAIEVSDCLSSGENELVVRAVDDTRSGLVPSGKQSNRFESYGCLYTRTTGIWQTVWLEAVPRTFIRNLRLTPDLDSGDVLIQAEVDGPSDGVTLVARAKVGGEDSADFPVGAHGDPVGEIRVSARGSYTFGLLKVEHLRPWSPEDPFLYGLEVTLERDGEVIDRVLSYFGFRRIHIDGYRLFLNGKPLFMRLVLDQGFYPDGIYTAPADEALKRDIEISLGLGFDGARLHQKVFEPRFLYWADRLGYLVWGEYPNWGLDHSHPQALERMLPEWLEVLARDYNHPSIIGWCPFNETPTNQNPWLLRSVYRVTKAIDQSRPVIDTSGYVHVETDIYDSHNYEQDPEKFKAAFEGFRESSAVFRNFPKDDAPYRGQPYFVSEYGGIWWNPGRGDDRSWGYGQRPASAEEFLDRYRGLTEALLFHPKMCGFCYTQLYDVEQETNGLYTYDRKPKFDPERIRSINRQKAAIEYEMGC